MKINKGLLFALTSFISFLVVIILLRNNNLGNSFFNLFIYIPYHDKIGHFVLMGILAFLSVITLTPLLPYSRLKSASVVMSIVLFIIAIEEGSQFFIPTRTFSLIDFVCDALGVFVFGSFGYLLLNKMIQEEK